VIIDKVPYKAILEQLPVQLAAGEGPDIARVTDLGGLSKYYLDITPYVKDAKYWEANFGRRCKWMRATPSDKGIYGMMTQLTVTGPFVNKTLFEQANVPLPGPKATWDDWAAATRKVAKATQVPFAIAFDRSGHRFAGRRSARARSLRRQGQPRRRRRLQGHGEEDLRLEQGRHDAEGSLGRCRRHTYRDAFEEFANGRVVMYLSGSWQIRRMEQQIGKNFDWIAVPNPCGPPRAPGMPGGAAFVALKRTKSPKDVGRFLDFLRQRAGVREYMARTENIPAHAGGRARRASITRSRRRPRRAAGRSSARCRKLSPTRLRDPGLQVQPRHFQSDRGALGQAIVGEMSLDDALKRIARTSTSRSRRARSSAIVAAVAGASPRSDGRSSRAYAASRPLMRRSTSSTCPCAGCSGCSACRASAGCSSRPT
jgi:alpha-1,4-digalacturonate transport system substrate-binding protein